MMLDAIRKFSEQFRYRPAVMHPKKLGRYAGYIIAGMGGSALSADLLTMWDPAIPLLVHRDYGLPVLPAEIVRNTLVIASSYSGNTEETLDAYQTARKKGIPVAVMAGGGKLLQRAKKDEVPYVVIPNTGIQPRMATGFLLKALAALMGKEKALKELSSLANVLKPKAYEKPGRALAHEIKEHVPVIYASTQNGALARIWKIKFNETAKIPAFYNVVPELNHNEMTSFDVKESTKMLTNNFYFIFLHDLNDHPRIQKRMEVSKHLYKMRGLGATMIELAGSNRFYKIFSSLLLGDWAAYYTAEMYGLESEQVPMVEEFKKMIAS